jgi:hypothetical protein
VKRVIITLSDDLAPLSPEIYQCDLYPESMGLRSSTAEHGGATFPQGKRTAGWRGFAREIACSSCIGRSERFWSSRNATIKDLDS